MVLEQLDICGQKKPKKMNTDLNLIPYMKIKSKWIININGKWKTIKPF